MTAAIEFDILNTQEASLAVNGTQVAGQHKASDEIDYAGLEAMQEDAELELLRHGMRRPSRRSFEWA